MTQRTTAPMPMFLLAVAPIEENVALAATASASSSFASRPPSKANDDITTTDITADQTASWASDGYTSAEAPDWLQMQFANQKIVSRVELYTPYIGDGEGNNSLRVKDYDVQYKDVDNVWQTLVSVTDNTSDHRTHTFTAVSCLKLRVLCYSGPTWQVGFARIVELQVWGYEDPDPPPPPVEVGYTVSGADMMPTYNGKYLEAGTFNGKPYYEIEAGGVYLAWDGYGNWGVGMYIDFDMGFFMADYTYASSADTPPAGTYSGFGTLTVTEL